MCELYKMVPELLRQVELELVDNDKVWNSGHIRRRQMGCGRET